VPDIGLKKKWMTMIDNHPFFSTQYHHRLWVFF